MSEKSKNLIIKDENGKILDIVKTNEKGFNKSIENSALWVIDANTGRLLPYANTAEFLSLSRVDTWYECVYKTDSDDEICKTETSAETNTGSTSSAGVDSTSSTKSTAIMHDNFLQKLENLIKERHEKMPEGSYTTHLFNSGGEKIRKKTGEEAFELVLAKEREEIIYEAADLIYHMMVLLESENIAFSEVVEELAKRES